MSDRRLLAISWDMPPLSGPRAVQVSRTLKHLAPLGWRSWVIAFDARSNRYNQDEELARALEAPGVTRVPVRSPEESLFFRALWRVCPPVKRLPDEKWVWIRPAVRAARRLAAECRFDALVSFAQPWSDHVIGRRLRALTGLPWIAHFSDPWSDSPHVHVRQWQRRLWARMESAVVKEADALVFVNSQTADYVMRKYPSEWRRRVHVVPHGFDPSEPFRAAAAPRRDSRLRIAYTGRFYEGFRTPESLLRAVASLARTRPLRDELHIAFVGTIVPAYRRLASQLGLDGIVEFTGRKSFADSTRLAAESDVLLVLDAPSGDNLFLPSKLVDYLPMHKPILGVTPPRGASADLIRSLGYPVVAPDDEPAIAGAITCLIAARQRGTLAPAPNHDVVARRYDISHTAAEFAAVLDQCA